MKRNFSNSIVLTFFLAAILVGCKSSQNIAEITTPTASDVFLMKGKGVSPKVNEVTFSGSLLWSDKNQKFEGKVNLINDTSLTLSLVSKAFGIEAFKIFFSGDSVFILNRLAKTFTKTSLDYIYNKTGYRTDFYDVKSILQGQFFNPVFIYDTLGVNNYSISKREEGYEYVLKFNTISPFLLPKIKNPEVDFSAALSFSSDLLNLKLVQNNANLSISTEYGSRSKNGWPTMIKFHFLGMGQSIDGEINYTQFSKVKKDEVVFNVPKSYQVILW